MSTPDSRTPQAPGQAARAAYVATTPAAFNVKFGPWEDLDPHAREQWEAVAQAAIAAAAPAPAGEGDLSGVYRERHELRKALRILAEAGSDEAADYLGQIELAEDAGLTPVEAARLSVAEYWQPRVDDLAARLIAITALLDASHKRDWDSQLPGERKRVAKERAEHGLEAMG